MFCSSFGVLQHIILETIYAKEEISKTPKQIILKRSATKAAGRRKLLCEFK